MNFHGILALFENNRDPRSRHDHAPTSDQRTATIFSLSYHAQPPLSKVIRATGRFRYQNISMPTIITPCPNPSFVLFEHTVHAVIQPNRPIHSLKDSRQETYPAIHSTVPQTTILSPAYHHLSSDLNSQSPVLSVP